MAQCAKQDCQQLYSEASVNNQKFTVVPFLAYYFIHIILVFTRGHVLQSSAESYRMRIEETYSQMKTLIEKDQQLMMNIIQMEELYICRWLESKRRALEHQIDDMNVMLSANKSLLQEDDHLKVLQVLDSFCSSKYASKTIRIYLNSFCFLCSILKCMNLGECYHCNTKNNTYINVVLLFFITKPIVLKSLK